ncbi:MAG: hypothetical protein AB1634_05590 [Thermodesulfobacteriota bacterium]
MSRGFAWCRLALAMVLVACGLLRPAAAEVEAGFRHLVAVMDRYHTSLDVYRERGSAGNHFAPSGWQGDVAALHLDPGWPALTHSGSTCIRVEFTARSHNWAAIVWQQPAGLDLSGASQLSFWARGAAGGETLEVFLGGEPGPAGDSLPRLTTGRIRLDTGWQQYFIHLTGHERRRLVTGFGLAVSGRDNPAGAIVFLDDITFDADRRTEPRLLASFETEADPADRHLAGVAHLYDNSLAILAFLARGGPDDRRRAGLLARALVLAQERDRFFHDGRLRNAYAAGDLLDPATGSPRLPVWQEPASGRYLEDSYQAGSQSGNLAWAVIALVRAAEELGEEGFRRSALALGEWLAAHTRDERGAGGYTGGYAGWEPDPAPLTWKSTEHNGDLYAAFLALQRLSGDPVWQERAEHARRFLLAMWDPAAGHYWTGALGDGCTVNRMVIPADAQIWPALAVPGAPDGLPWARAHLVVERDGRTGLDFNDDRDGIWCEGTAAAALAWRLRQDPLADSLLASLRAIQASAAGSNGAGLLATPQPVLSTGLEWQYPRRVHLAATAWYLLAELAANPLAPPDRRSSGR